MVNRVRKGLPISGWLVINKAAGMTSAQVVGKVRWLTKAQKVGHAGTLDPLATGVLPIALGEATKTVNFAMDKRKTYRFTVKWGEATDTEDCEGAVVRTSPVRPDATAIKTALPGFIGTIYQVPPAYSALKIDGQRAYDLSRRGDAPEMTSRPVTIHSLTLIEALPDSATLEAEVGKGTYVRSLARDLALALGTEGHITALARLRVGKFCIEDAISLEQLEEKLQGAGLDAHMLPVETVLDDIPALALTVAEAGRVRQGGSLVWIAKGDAERLEPLRASTNGIGLALSEGKPVALVELSGIELRPIRVLNL